MHLEIANVGIVSLQGSFLFHPLLRLGPFQLLHEVHGAKAAAEASGTFNFSAFLVKLRLVD